MTHHIRPETPLHVVFVISTLGRGGSERQMINLATELNRRGHRAEIATLREPGPLAEEARRAGNPVLPMSRSGRQFASLFGLVRYVRRTRPQVVHPYLPRDNALTALLKPFFRGSRLVWGIRSADVDWSQYGRSAKHLWRLVVFLSRSADLHIANSEFGAHVHIDQGFPADKVIVVPNGIDTNRFHPDQRSRTSARSKWQVSPDTCVVGMLGRFDPMKGHDQVLDVVEVALGQRRILHLVVVGLHSPQESHDFMSRAREMGLEDFVTLMPESETPHEVLTGFDVLVLPSVSEAFPNVVAEALSCGVPVAAYDVGDVKEVVDACGTVVPRGDAEALGLAIIDLSGRSFDRSDMHTRIHDIYGIATLADRSLDAFHRLLEVDQGK